MNNIRKPTVDELRLLERMLKHKNDNYIYLVRLPHIYVSDMDDGGMHSLHLLPSEASQTRRKFGKQIVLCQWRDEDGVDVSAAINIDTKSQLYELDIWKVDFSSLIRMPSDDSLVFIDPVS